MDTGKKPTCVFAYHIDRDKSLYETTFYHYNVLRVEFSHHFIVICDSFGLLKSLKPHHVLGVESPRQFLKSFRCKVLRLSSLQKKTVQLILNSNYIVTNAI